MVKNYLENYEYVLPSAIPKQFIQSELLSI